MKLRNISVERDAERLMGFKGSSFLDTGYFWAPYVPLTTAPTVLDPDSQEFKSYEKERKEWKIGNPVTIDETTEFIEKFLAENF